MKKQREKREKKIKQQNNNTMVHKSIDYNIITCLLMNEYKGLLAAPTGNFEIIFVLVSAFLLLMT